MKKKWDKYQQFEKEKQSRERISMKLNWYQQKDICSFSKKNTESTQIHQRKKVVFKAVLNVDFLWHTSKVFYRAERHRPRPN